MGARFTKLKQGPFLPKTGFSETCTDISRKKFSKYFIFLLTSSTNVVKFSTVVEGSIL
jgi:hypothetical protein